MTFDATISAEVVADFNRAVAEMAVRDATIDRLAQQRDAPTPPK